jgi:hypothetical protein
MSSAHIKITMDKAMVDALQAIAKKEKVTMSEIIRQQMDLFPQTPGVELDTSVQWGGRRESKGD